MNFSEHYKKLKPSVVAVVSRFSMHGDFPEIIGTGFVAKEDGLIVTNNHVIQAIKKLPRLKNLPDQWPIQILAFHFIEGKGLISAHLEVEGVGTLSRTEPIEGVHYGPDVPDLGYIFVKTRGLPTLEIENSVSLSEGDEIFVAGFPLGTSTLRAPGWIHQINPVLQRGVLSAMQPFVCEKPHGFLIDVVSQGGASGSPIFNPTTGKVAAVLWGGIPGTSLTQAVPAYILYDLLNRDIFDSKTGEGFSRDTASYPTLQDRIEAADLKPRIPKTTNPELEPINPEDLIMPS